MRSAFLMGLPKGVMKRGVLIIGVSLSGVRALDDLGVFPAGSTRSPPKELSRGERDKEGEWNCDGGADMGGVISLGVTGADMGGVVSLGVIVLGVIGADMGGGNLGTAGLGVIGAELTSLWSPMFTVPVCLSTNLLRYLFSP